MKSAIGLPFRVFSFLPVVLLELFLGLDGTTTGFDDA
jgi:hypothetical protein